MYRLKGQDVSNVFPHQLQDVWSKRPKAHLGKLALQKYLVAQDDTFETGRKSMFNTITHHTALMRQPELVVKYLPGPVSANPQIGYAGVFITDQDKDKIFADSEPPTHDDWIADSLNERWHQVYVRVSQRRIFDYMETFAKPADVQPKSRELTPLGAFSNSLGSSLLSAVPGNSASTPFSPLGRSNVGKITAKPATGPTKKPTLGPHGPATEETKPKGMFGRLVDQIRGTRDESTEPPPGTAQEVLTTLPEPPQFPPPEAKPSSLPSAPDIHKIPVLSGENNTRDDQPSPKPVKKKLGKSMIRANGAPTFVEVDGHAALQVSFTVNHGRNAIGTNVAVKVNAVIDGTALETEPPLGGSQSEVIRWIDADNQLYAGSQTVFVEAASTGEWKVIVSLPDDMMVDVNFIVTAKGSDE